MKFTCIPALAALFFAACGKEEHAHSPGDGHDHAKAGESHGGHGSMTKLGNIQLGDLVVSVAQEGKLEAGKELGLDLTFLPGKPMPQSVRAWVGVESAAGSVKAKLTKEGESGMHQHVEVPSPLPAGSAIWIEADIAGKAVKASVAPR